MQSVLISNLLHPCFFDFFYFWSYFGISLSGLNLNKETLDLDGV